MEVLAVTPPSSGISGRYRFAQSAQTILRSPSIVDASGCSAAICEEILMVLKMASVLAIHSCSLGAPILLEEAQAAGVRPVPKPSMPTPDCDQVRALGQWNDAWNPFLELDPAWTDQFIATGASIYAGGVMTPQLVELLSIAFDASYTHMYAPGTQRHIKAALKLGVSLEEIMEVLKLCVVQGVQACNLGVPILVDELRRLKGDG